MTTQPELLATAVQYHRAGNLSEAEKLYSQLLHGNPDDAEALHLLGVIAHQRGRHEMAIDYIRRALQFQPFADAYNNLGVVLKTQRKLDEAVASYQEALRLKPDYPDALNNLGVALKELGQVEESIDSYRQALALDPNFAEAHNNLGNSLKDMGDLAAAAACYRQAIQLKPSYADAHLNQGVAYLLTGDFGRGWAEYEWRWQCPETPPRPFRQPFWDGAPLSGRTILLHAEQGLGDTLHFMRYAPLVQARGGRVVLECQKALLPLLAGCRGVDQLLGYGTPLPAFNVHAPLMSLPGIFGANLTNLPAEVPYLTARPDLVEHWRLELSALSGFKIGIAWQGSRTNRGDRQRSIPLAQFAPLAQIPGVRLLSLQKGHGAEQLGALAGRFTVTDLASRLDEANGPFMDTAAVMKNVDLVITSDTATAHLAGALGVPVWVPLTLVPDWRWLLERADSPWYPTMRLFRQSRRGAWADVFERMTAELTKVSGGRALVPKRQFGNEIDVTIAPGELIDKITILQIKSERITDAAKLHNVHAELALLLAARDGSVPASADLDALTVELRGVNEQLWDIEDAIRLCDRQHDFGPRFIALARSVYRNNDQRAALKRRINERLGSTIVEEKSYAVERQEQNHESPKNENTKNKLLGSMG